jgi:16S rRNA U516 pseudouridylate synthase RsuA-like enzyme
MVRTQIQLTEGQIKTLKRLASEQQRSVAELIRQSIDQYLAAIGELPLDQQYERAMAVVGKYRSGDADLGRNHDQYLAEAYAAPGSSEQ